MINATVTLHGNWANDLIRKAELSVPIELAEASRLGAEAASTVADRRHRTGKMAEMEILEVHGTATGWEGGFRSRAWYAVFQNKGTRRGIKGLHFLEKGRTVARKDLIERLNRRLGSS